MVNAAIPVGIFGGLAVGAAAGIALEVVSRPVQDPTVADMNTWENEARDEFEGAMTDDTLRREEMNSAVREYVRDHPLPPRTTAGRDGGHWSFTRPDEKTRGGLMFACTAATIGGTIGGLVLAMRKASHPDMARISGAGGAARLGMPIAFAAFGAAMIISSATD